MMFPGALHPMGAKPGWAVLGFAMRTDLPTFASSARPICEDER
jgi:hypothetical protein